MYKASFGALYDFGQTLLRVTSANVQWLGEGWDVCDSLADAITAVD
jgi:hypothetical protein